MLTLLPDLDDYMRLSDRDLELALALLDVHPTPTVARVLGCAPSTLRRNLAAIGWTR